MRHAIGFLEETVKAKMDSMELYRNRLVKVETEAKEIYGRLEVMGEEIRDCEKALNLLRALESQEKTAHGIGGYSVPDPAVVGGAALGKGLMDERAKRVREGEISGPFNASPLQRL